MRILLTGGSGFIGSHFINYFLQDESVEFILNLDLQKSEVRNSILNTIILDIREPKFWDSHQIEGHFDCCIHLAALCKEPGFEWEEYFETNHIGTRNVVTLCEKLGIKDLIFTSTMMVYKAGEMERTEESNTAPDTAYGISKLLAEKELEAWAKGEKDRSIKIIRPAVVFGENENANFTRLYRSLKRGFFPFIGRSSTVKSNIYVKELVYFMDFLISNHTSNHIFNLAFKSENKMKDIVSAFKEVFGFAPFTPTLPYRPMLLVARFFEVLNAIGLNNSIHHRRIQKLYHSTNIYPKAALDDGYQFKFDLQKALEDWKESKDENL